MPVHNACVHMIPHDTLWYRTALPSANTAAEHMHFVHNCPDPRGLCKILRLCTDYCGRLWHKNTKSWIPTFSIITRHAKCK